VAARGLTSMRVTEAVWGALASMLPGKVFSCGAQGDFGVTIAGYSAERRPFVLLEFLFGTWGGRPDKDAIDALSSLAVNYSNTPVEIVEREQPIRIEEYGFRQDSCGPENFAADWAWCGNTGSPAWTRRSAGPQRPPEIPPLWLEGRTPGANAANYLRSSDNPKQALPGKFMRTSSAGNAIAPSWRAGEAGAIRSSATRTRFCGMWWMKKFHGKARCGIMAWW
jgi:N-methylhydantoinase B